MSGLDNNGQNVTQKKPAPTTKPTKKSAIDGISASRWKSDENKNIKKKNTAAVTKCIRKQINDLNDPGNKKGGKQGTKASKKNATGENKKNQKASKKATSEGVTGKDHKTGQQRQNKNANDEKQKQAKKRKEPEPSADAIWANEKTTANKPPSDDYGCKHLGIECLTSHNVLDAKNYYCYVAEGKLLHDKVCRDCKAPAPTWKDMQPFDKETKGIFGYVCRYGMIAGDLDANENEAAREEKARLTCMEGTLCRECGPKRRERKWQDEKNEQERNGKRRSTRNRK